MIFFHLISSQRQHDIPVICLYLDYVLTSTLLTSWAGVTACVDSHHDMTLCQAHSRSCNSGQIFIAGRG